VTPATMIYGAWQNHKLIGAQAGQFILGFAA
jgi:hypothetical protein